MGNDNFVLLITGPNAVGKGSLVKAILDTDSNFRKVIRHTTRVIGNGETNGITYHFIVEKKFEEMKGNDEFVEWFKFPSGYYGTSKEALVEPIHEGLNSIVEMDVDAARDVKKYLKSIKVKCIDVFVIPTTVEDFKKPGGIDRVIEVMFARIEKRNRGFDSSQIELETRKNFAKRWLTEVKDFKYLLANPDGQFEKSVNDLREIIGSN